MEELAELLNSGTIALTSADGIHEVSILVETREQAEAIMDALERIADGRS